MSRMFDRREFLITGSAALGALATAPFAGGSEAAFQSAMVPVGYWDDVPGLFQRLGLTSSFVPAESVLAGDPTLFGTDARFRVHGYRGVAADGQWEHISLDVLFDVPELGRKIEHFAWTTIARGGRLESSRSLSFRVPVDPMGTTDLCLERRSFAATAGVTNRSVIRFSVNPVTGAIPLRRGIYAIALLDHGQSVPDWRSVRLGRPASASGVGPAVLLDAHDTEVGFSHLLLSVA